MSEKKVFISMIAAVSRDGIIGIDGKMPWKIPSDFAHFRRFTMGKPMIMGRKQFETLGKPLLHRVNIVVSRQQGYQPDGVIVINDFAAAISHAKSLAQADRVDEIMIIGGGEIYRLGMQIADRLYISHVELDVGDKAGTEKVVFPPIDNEVWDNDADLKVSVNPNDEATYSIKIYTRVGPKAH